MKINAGVLLHVLTLVFVVLKLMGTVTWSWWWVVSPTLASLGLSILILAIAGFALSMAFRSGNFRIKP